MKSFYYVIDKLKTELLTIPFVNTVTEGAINDVDMAKQTIYPLSHIMVNSARLTSNTIVFNVSILSMDIVDYSKELTTDIFIGNDNTQDILNEQLIVQARLIKSLSTGDLSEYLELLGEATSEPFSDRFEHTLAGWTVTFDVVIPNEMSVC